jgi:hypothetical protein
MALGQYESIRHQVQLFDEASPEERKVLFERVWELLQSVGSAFDLRNAEVALLHDALTNAARFMIEVYAREQDQGRTVIAGVVEDLDAYRAQLKAS